jgi:hypothetical protein
MRENPLFIDSTKSRGDNIHVHFELNDVFLYEEEILLLKIVDEVQKRHHEIELKNHQGIYSAKVFLPHMNRIKYQYVVLKNSQVKFFSVVYEGIVNYVFEDSWRPAFLIPLLFDQPLTPSANDSNIYDQFKENKNLLGNLIKHWGL